MSLNQAKRLILMRNRSTPKQDTNFSKSNTFHHFWFLIDVYVGDYIAWKLNAYNQFWTTCLSKKKKKKKFWTTSNEKATSWQFLHLPIIIRL